MTFRRAYTTFSRLRPKRLALVSTGAFAGAFAVSVDLPDLPDRSSLSHASTLTLLRSYFVWSLLSVDTLVDASPAILDKLLHSSIPGVTTLTEGFIRRTFFPQFIPGEDALQCVPTMERLRRRNFGTALNYSAEADTQENNPLDPHEARFREVETAIDAQGAFEQRMAAEGWAKGSSAFALKVIIPIPGFPSAVDESVLNPASADLTPFNSLERIVPSLHVAATEPGLQTGDLEELRLLWERLDSLAERSRRNGVRLILDAEESYYEPALDGYVMMLSKKYNRPIGNTVDKVATEWNGPVIYGSYQCYLQRQPSFLQEQIKTAEAEGYALGIKLVRGGYIVKEQGHWQAAGKEGNGPVWPTKAQSDDAYNGSIATILDTLSTQLESKQPELALSVIFGTHNLESVKRIIHTVEEKGLAVKDDSGRLKLRPQVEGKVRVAQLYGMRDDITDLITSSFAPSNSPISMIFMAYGRLRETLPFLSRRSVENKSVMSGAGGAVTERRRVGKELARRFSLGFL